MRAFAVSKRDGVWVSLLAASSAFGVYLYTLCPTVYAGDSGELSLACLEYGIPHPPGYPLFVLLGRVACLFGSRVLEPAVVTNAMCAALSALTVGGVFLLLYRVLASVVAALAGAWILAFSATFWGQATVTEVYPLACLGFLGLLVTVEALERTGRPWLLYVLAYLSGLVLTLHQSFVLILPAVIGVLLARRRQFNHWKAGLLFALGLSPYLLVMFRSMSDPFMDWGDPESPTRLLAVMLRRNYGELAQNPLSVGLFFGHFQAFFQRLSAEIPLPLLVFAPLGIRRLHEVRPAVNRFMTIGFFGFVAGLFVVIRPSLDSVHLYQISFYYMPVYIVFAVWTTVGIHQAYVWIVRAALRQREDSERPAPSARLGHALVACVLLAPVWIVAQNFEANNRRDFFDARIYGENIFRSMPPGATLVTDGDNETFVLAYLQRALGVRPDIRLVHKKGYLFDAPAYLKNSSRDELGRNAARWQREILEGIGRVYYATFVDLSEAAPRWSLVREGIVYRAVRIAVADNGRPGSPVALAGVSRDGRTDRLLRAYDTSVLEREPRTMEFIARKFAIGYLEAMWDARDCTGQSAGGLLAAVGEMGYDFAEAQFFVGNALEDAGDLEGALAAYVASARLDPEASYPWAGIERVYRQAAISTPLRAE